MDSDRTKHLEFIQATMNRLSNNSFSLKGWTVTLVAALFALAANDSQQRYAVVAVPPALCFSALDAYDLRQERLFRALYDHAILPDSSLTTFSMDTKLCANKVDRWSVILRSKTLAPFYGTILLAAIIGTLTTWGEKANAPLVRNVNAAVVIAPDVKSDHNSQGGLARKNADYK